MRNSPHLVDLRTRFKRAAEDRILFDKLGINVRMRTAARLKNSVRFAIFNVGETNERQMWATLHIRLSAEVFNGVIRIKKMIHPHGKDIFSVWVDADRAHGLKMGLCADYEARQLAKASGPKPFVRVDYWRNAWRVDFWREARDSLLRVPLARKFQSCSKNKLVSINVNGFWSKVTEVNRVTRHGDVAVLALQETLTSKDHYSVQLDGYKVYERRAHNSFRGQALLVRADLPSWEVKGDTSDWFIHIKVCRLGGVPWHIISVYLPSGGNYKSDRSKCIRELKALCKVLLADDPNVPIVILGDFNTNRVALDSLLRTAKGVGLIVKHVSGCDITRIVNTKDGKGARSSLDHMVVSPRGDALLRSVKVDRGVKLSDHYAIKAVVRVAKRLVKAALPEKPREVWSMARLRYKMDVLANHHAFDGLMGMKVGNGDDLDVYYDGFVEAVKQAGRDAQVLNDVTSRPKKYMPRQLKLALLERQNALTAWRNLEVDKVGPQTIRKCAMRVSRAEKSLREVRNATQKNEVRKGSRYLADTLIHSDTKLLFEGVNKLLKGQKKESGFIPVKDTSGVLQTDKESILRVVADHFKQLADPPSAEMIERAAQADYKTEEVLKDFTIDLETLGKSLLLAIRGKKRGTAPGPNGIPIEVYKGLLSVESDAAAVKKFTEAESDSPVATSAPSKERPLPYIVHVAVADDDLPDHMSTPMGQAFEKLLRSQIINSDHFAKGLGDASITPLVKNPKGDVSSMDNRRGLAVGNEEAKILFTMLARQLSAKLEASNWFTKMQSGFRANQECIGQFIALFEIARRCRLKGKDLFVVFIDLQKAFDTVMHEAMWQKLEAMGLGGHELEVIKSLYKSGKVRVKIDELFSYSFGIGKGTRQGDPLSPLLFIIFINDLLVDCPFGADVPGLAEKVPGLLFADDLAGLCDSIESVHEFLKKLELWCDTWGMRIGASKCNVLYVGDDMAKKLACDTANFRCQDHPILAATSYKYLGIVVDSTKLGVEYTSEWSYVLHLARKVREQVQHCRPLFVDANICLAVKRQVYLASVFSVALYGAEWIGMRSNVSYIQKELDKALKLILGSTMKNPIFTSELLSWELSVPLFNVQAAVARLRLWRKAPSVKGSILNDLAISPFSDRRKSWFTYTSWSVQTLEAKVLKKDADSPLVPYWMFGELPRVLGALLPPNLLQNSRERSMGQCDGDGNPLPGWNALSNASEHHILCIANAYFGASSSRCFMIYDQSFFGWSRHFYMGELYDTNMSHGAAILMRIRMGAYDEVRKLLSQQHVASDHLEAGRCAVCKLRMYGKQDAFSKGDDILEYWSGSELAHILLDCGAFEHAREGLLEQAICLLDSEIRSLKCTLSEGQIRGIMVIFLLGGLMVIPGLPGTSLNHLGLELSGVYSPLLDSWANGYGHVAKTYPRVIGTQGFALVAKFLGQVYPIWKDFLFRRDFVYLNRDRTGRLRLPGERVAMVIDLNLTRSTEEVSPRKPVSRGMLHHIAAYAAGTARSLW